jgi:aminoglycoside/choline kinase family phosphotransferase
VIQAELFTTELSRLFTEQFGEEPQQTKLLPASGSDRRYVRLSAGNKSAIGAYNPYKNENNTFFYFTRVFTKYGLPVPELLGQSPNKETYLLEDLGNTSLFQIIEQEGHSDRVKSLLKKSIDQLVRFHWEASREIDYSICFSAKTFDRQQIFSDLLYFKYYFADLLKINYDRPALLEELEEWSKTLGAARPQTFMYRDFQSRNIHVKNEEVFFIDYQGGMLGLPQYDLASLLWQARAQFSDDWKNELLNYYFTALSALPEKPGLNETEFRRTYLDCVLLRILQTLGAYGFRGLMERKPHFVKSIKPALKQLAAFLDTYPHLPVYNELRKLLGEMVKPEIIARFENDSYDSENKNKLKVQVYSFSYKKGMPADISGHGGGFVFDCRGILNPGRFEAYKSITGKDNAVIEFLEGKTLMPNFMENVYGVVDISIEDYLKRGFDHLSISFGCTGGQHRSVYAAEAMVRHLRDRYGLDAEIIHLEQDKHKIGRR